MIVEQIYLLKKQMNKEELREYKRLWIKNKRKDNRLIRYATYLRNNWYDVSLKTVVEKKQQKKQ